MQGHVLWWSDREIEVGCEKCRGSSRSWKVGVDRLGGIGCG